MTQKRTNKQRSKSHPFCGIIITGTKGLVCHKVVTKNNRGRVKSKHFVSENIPHCFVANPLFNGFGCNYTGCSITFILKYTY